MAILNKDTSIGDITDVYDRLSNLGPPPFLNLIA